MYVTRHGRRFHTRLLASAAYLHSKEHVLRQSQYCNNYNWFHDFSALYVVFVILCDFCRPTIKMATTMAGNIILKFRTFLLGPVFGLERNEYVAVAWSFICFFCVLSSYYIIRPVREAMAVDSGASTVPLLFSATFVVMMAATPVFGWVTSRYPRRIFLPWVYLFFIANILLFWLIFSQIIDDGEDHIWLPRFASMGLL